MVDNYKLAKPFESLKELVMSEWDPIGVKNFPEAQDEYDTYVYELLGLLARKISEEELFFYLWQLETKHIGMPGNELATRRFAKRLMRWPP